MILHKGLKSLKKTVQVCSGNPKQQDRLLQDRLLWQDPPRDAEESLDRVHGPLQIPVETIVHGKRRLPLQPQHRSRNSIHTRSLRAECVFNHKQHFYHGSIFSVARQQTFTVVFDTGDLAGSHSSMPHKRHCLVFTLQDLLSAILNVVGVCQPQQQLFEVGRECSEGKKYH